MASAAPAAPATSTAPAAESSGYTPSSVPTNVHGDALPAEDPGDSQSRFLNSDGTPRRTRSVKPIPPSPGKLPGVFPDDDPFPLPPSSSRDAAPSTSTERASTPGRGPDGRFVAAGTSPAAAGDGEHTLQPSETPAPPKFKFGGEEFDSQEAAEQNFRSLRGQYKPLQSLARSLGGVDKIATTLSDAALSAREWKAAHDRVMAELDAYRSGHAPAATSPQPPADPSADQPGIDWELYAEVKKLATEAGEPWKAEKWLIEETAKAERTRYERLLDEKLSPFTAQREQQAVAAHTETLFGSLAEYTNSDGSPAFPELADETSAYEVGKLWATLGLPADYALTPQGAIAAIGIYRMAKGQTPQASPAPNAPRPAAPAPPAVLQTDALSAAALVEGRPTVASVPGEASPSAEAARILAGLRSANQNSRAALGFDA